MSLRASGCYPNGIGTFSEDLPSWYTLNSFGHSERLPQTGLTPTLFRLWHQNENRHYKPAGGCNCIGTIGGGVPFTMARLICTAISKRLHRSELGPLHIPYTIYLNHIPYGWLTWYSCGNPKNGRGVFPDSLPALVTLFLLLGCLFQP